MCVMCIVGRWNTFPLIPNSLQREHAYGQFHAWTRTRSFFSHDFLSSVRFFTKTYDFYVPNENSHKTYINFGNYVDQMKIRNFPPISVYYLCSHGDSFLIYIHLPHDNISLFMVSSSACWCVKSRDSKCLHTLLCEWQVLNRIVPCVLCV